MLIHSNFQKKYDLAHLKSDVAKLDIDKLEKLTSRLNNLKSTIGKFDFDKLKSVPVNLGQVMW